MTKIIKESFPESEGESTRQVVQAMNCLQVYRERGRCG